MDDKTLRKPGRESYVQLSTFPLWYMQLLKAEIGLYRKMKICKQGSMD